MRTGRRLAAGTAAAGAAAAAYMVFESQWLDCREQQLNVPGLPDGLAGLTILHLSDVHAGQPGLNLRLLARAVEWGAAMRPDLVFLTGDILGSGRGSERCLELLASLRPRLGGYAVAGNHEYGLSKNPFAHRPQLPAWHSAGIRFLKDECALVTLPGSTPRLAVCGADYVTGGHPLLRQDTLEADFSILLIHRPPEPDDPLGALFPLAFAGHTHGGQIRVPGPRGWVIPHRVDSTFVQGVHPWGRGLVVVSQGVGTTFLPLRLFTRPEAVLYRLAPNPDGSESGVAASDSALSGIHSSE